MRQDSDDNSRLLRAFDQLPKTIHSTDVFKRHPEVRPEWIMRIILEDDHGHGTSETGVQFAEHHGDL